MARIKTIRDLRNELIEVVEGLKAGTVDVKQASNMNQVANTIIKSTATQLLYAKARKEKPEIGFLKCR